MEHIDDVDILEQSQRTKKRDEKVEIIGKIETF